MGGLWGREDILNSMRTIQSGVKQSKHPPMMGSSGLHHLQKFEGGLGHFAGMMATGAAIDYLSTLDMNQVHEHEINLNRIMSDGVKDLDGVSIIIQKMQQNVVASVHYCLMKSCLHTISPFSLTSFRRNGSFWTTLRPFMV